MKDRGQQRLIAESFAQLRRNAVAGERFYQNLFVQNPGLRPMFAGTSMAEQGGKLMQMLTAVVEGLGRWDQMAAELEAMGRRHQGYGVQPDHYAAVGTALLTTLRDLLQDDFTDDCEGAWAELYTELSLVMERGGRAAGPVAGETRLGAAGIFGESRGGDEKRDGKR